MSNLSKDTRRVDANALCLWYRAVQTQQNQICLSTLGALPDPADKTANCKVMTAGERPSSRSQDPDVRPRGTDYCLGFEMDVSSVHAKSRPY